MPLAVRILLAWSTVSVIVSPFVGKVLASGSQAPATVPSAPPALHIVQA